MILQNMTRDEAFKICMNDMRHYRNLINPIIRRYQSKIRKQPKCVIHEYMEFFSKKSNQRYILPFNKRMHDTGIHGGYVAEVQVSPTKFNYYVLEENDLTAVVITDHFIEQFRNREHIMGTKREALYEYLKRCMVTCCVYRNDNKVVYALKNGLALGVNDNKRAITTYCTYIGLNELKPSQLNAYKTVEKVIDDCERCKVSNAENRDPFTYMIANARMNIDGKCFETLFSEAKDIYKDYFESPKLRYDVPTAPKSIILVEHLSCMSNLPVKDTLLKGVRLFNN